MSQLLIVNDKTTCIPGTKTLWHELNSLPFNSSFYMKPYNILADSLEKEIALADTSLIIRNASYCRPFKINLPTIAILQDILQNGGREEQIAVCLSPQT